MAHAEDCSHPGPTRAWTPLWTLEVLQPWPPPYRVNKLGYVPFTRDLKRKIKHERKRILFVAELDGVGSFDRRGTRRIFLGAGPKRARTPVSLYTRSPRGLEVANIVGFGLLRFRGRKGLDASPLLRRSWRLEGKGRILEAGRKKKNQGHDRSWLG